MKRGDLVGAALAAKPKYIAAKAAPTSGRIIVVFNAHRNKRLWKPNDPFGFN
jgi:hypothetical protein